jgi:hypothetical protein
MFFGKFFNAQEDCMDNPLTRRESARSTRVAIRQNDYELSLINLGTLNRARRHANRMAWIAPGKAKRGVADPDLAYLAS